MTADEDVRECVFATVSAFLGSFIDAGQGYLFGVTLGIFHLYSVEQFTIHDSFVMVLEIVLDNLAIVLYSLVCEEVRTVGFLREDISLVFFVSEDYLQDCRIPFCVLLQKIRRIQGFFLLL